MFPGTSVTSWRHGNLGALFHHIWWDCPIVMSYRKLIWKEIKKKNLAIEISLSMRIVLLHNFKSSLHKALLLIYAQMLPCYW